MKCNECTNVVLSIDDLLINKDTSCKKCRKIKNEIEKSQVLAWRSYEEILQNEICKITPLYYNDHIIVANTRAYEFNEYCAEDCLRTISKLLGVYNYDISLKNEKYNFFNMLLGKIYDEIYEEISGQEERILLLLLSSLEFNRFLMMGLVMWLRCGEMSAANNVLLDSMLQTLETYKTMSECMPINCIKYEELYCQFESILALDKHAFEYGIELLEYKRSRSNGYENCNTKINFKRVIQLLRALSLVNYYKVETTEGKMKNCSLRVDEKGSLKFDNKTINYFVEYVNEMQETFEQDNDGKYEQEINVILKSKKGFDIELIKKLLTAVQSSNILSDEYLVGDKHSWICAIMNSCDCEYEVANKVFHDFVYIVDKVKLFSANSRMENRAMRKCLFKYKDCYITVANLLLFALVNWINEIYTGEITEFELKKELQQIYEEMNIDFEESVYLSLKRNLNIDTIKWNVQFIRNVDLSGQIDVLLYLNKKIFVVECKNLNIKSHPKVSANEYHQFTRKSKKSFQDKLNKKVLEISRNKEKILEYLGAKNHDNEMIEIVGVFVVRVFTDATVIKNEGYDVVTANGICDWVRSKAFEKE